MLAIIHFIQARLGRLLDRIAEINERLSIKNNLDAIYSRLTNKDRQMHQGWYDAARKVPFSVFHGGADGEVCRVCGSRTGWIKDID